MRHQRKRKCDSILKEVESVNIVTSKRLKYCCNLCKQKFEKASDLQEHKDRVHAKVIIITDTSSSGNSDSSEEEWENDTSASKNLQITDNKRENIFSKSSRETISSNVLIKKNCSKQASVQNTVTPTLQSNTSKHTIKVVRNGQEVHIRQSNGVNRKSGSNEVISNKQQDSSLISKRTTVDNQTEDEFMCDLCFDVFISSQELEDHRTQHIQLLKNKQKTPLRATENASANSPTNKKLCPYCEEVPFGLKHFVVQHVPNCKTFVALGRECYFCSYKSGYRYQIMSHIRSKHFKTCYICHSVIDGNLVAHIKSHSELPKTEDQKKVDDLPCLMCPKVFKSQEELKEHNKTHRKICKQCSKPFVTFGALKFHVEAVHEGQSKKCETCGKIYTSLAGLTKHRRRHEMGEEAYQEKMANLPKIKCSFCPKIIRKDRLRKHLNMHQSAIIVCDVCGASVRKIFIKQHTLLHSNIMYECKVCKKKHPTSNAANTCANRDTNTKPYKCDLCEKAYLYKNSLEVHTRLHTGEKPFPCTICDRKFYTDEILYKHMLAHGIDTRSGKVPRAKRRIAEEMIESK